MSLPAWSRPLADAFRGERFKPTVILLSSMVLMVTWKYLGAPGFFLERFPASTPLWDEPTAAAAIYSFVACLVLLGVVPALIVKGVFRERLADYGVQLGDGAFGMKAFLLLAPAFLLVAYLSIDDPGLVAEYPINKGACGSQARFGFHTLTFLLFYVGWEFHFRGYLQFGLAGSMGKYNAVLVQVLASCLLHIGKPGSEIYGSILGGLLWGVLAFRTRSVLSGLLQHALMGLAVDWFVCFA